MSCVSPGSRADGEIPVRTTIATSTGGCVHPNNTAPATIDACTEETPAPAAFAFRARPSIATTAISARTTRAGRPAAASTPQRRSTPGRVTAPKASFQLKTSPRARKIYQWRWRKGDPSNSRASARRRSTRRTRWRLRQDGRGSGARRRVTIAPNASWVDKNPRGYATGPLGREDGVYSARLAPVPPEVRCRRPRERLESARTGTFERESVFQSGSECHGGAAQQRGHLLDERIRCGRHERKSGHPLQGEGTVTRGRVFLHRFETIAPNSRDENWTPTGPPWDVHVPCAPSIAPFPLVSSSCSP